MFAGRIRFIATPRGQAPQWVRDAWIGVTVPCTPFIDIPPEGNLRGVEDGSTVASYQCASVPQKEAIEALAQHNAKAAEWWRLNGFGDESAPFFAFNRESFEIISGVGVAKIDVYDDLETGRWESPQSGR